MKLVFPQDVIREGKILYKAGEVYEISNELGSAWHWLKRGAVEVEENSLETPEEPKQNEPEVAEIEIVQTSKKKSKSKKMADSDKE